MPKTRQEIIDAIDNHRHIVSNPASSRENISASRIAILALEHDLKNSADNWGAGSVPVIRTSEDFEELKKKASQGDAETQCAVADICADYTRTEFYNTTEAVYWYEKAAEQGFTRAQWLLGASYFQGMGIEKDLTKAEQWLLRAAESGDVDGQYALGGFYFMKPDIVKAEYWLEKAAAQGHKEAKAGLGAVKKLLETYI